MSIRLYVGNLPKEIDPEEFKAVFAEWGNSVTTKVIKDRKTGKCRGFGFVTVKTDEQADEIIEKCNGHMLQENALKIEKALPRSKKKTEPEQEEKAPRSKGSGNAARRGGNNKARRNNQSTSEPEAIQPDPRWAAELAKLKEMLAAQATNS